MFAGFDNLNADDLVRRLPKMSGYSKGLSEIGARLASLLNVRSPAEGSTGLGRWSDICQPFHAVVSLLIYRAHSGAHDEACNQRT